MTLRLVVTVDVPELDAGVAFYRAAIGFEETARPHPAYAVMVRDGARLGIMEKPPGSRPAKGADDTRRYGRHWTPVHVDFHVAAFGDALARALDAGAVCEERFEDGGRPPVAFCSDPFGHGFCIIGPAPAATDGEAAP